MPEPGTSHCDGPALGRDASVRALFRLIFCVLLLTGWALAALSLHVVQTPQTLTIIPKNRLGIVDTFVDTRNWKLEDAEKHPEVVGRMLELQKTSLLSHLSRGGDVDALERSLRDAVRRGRERHMSETAALIRQFHIAI